MKLSLTNCGEWKRFDGKKIPDKFRILEIEILFPNSFEEEQKACFHNGEYVVWPIFKKANRFFFDVSFPSCFPTEGDGYIAFSLTATRNFFSIGFYFGRFCVSYSTDDGFRWSNCMATGIGG